MLTIKNINNILYNDLTIHRKIWKITGITETDNGKPQYQFYLSDGKEFITVYLDRIINTSKHSGNIPNKDYYKLHTSQNVNYVTTEELRSVGSTMFWLEVVCEQNNITC
jgi:hypothetical protein